MEPDHGACGTDFGHGRQMSSRFMLREGKEVPLLDLHGGLPFWLVRNGLGLPFPQLHADLVTDVVVVGAGVTGALCAFHLAEEGVECAVVDARTIGTGSTCASTALLQYEIDTPLRELRAHVGLDHAVRSYRACVNAIGAIERISRVVGDDSFRRRPSIQYASRFAHVDDLQAEAELRMRHGFDVRFASTEEAQEWLPFSVPAAVRSEVGAEMDAWRFTMALHRWNTARGVQAFERTAVNAFDITTEGVRLGTQSGHAIRAEHVVMATGYESQAYLPEPVVDLHSTYALITERSDMLVPWRDNALLWETARPYHYLRTTEDGRIIIGGLDEPFRAPALRDALLARKTLRLEKKLAKLFPERTLKREFAWCGTFGSTKDGLPYIDRHPEHDRLWFALGMGGNGITFSVTAAEIIRDAILGRPNSDAELFGFER